MSETPRMFSSEAVEGYAAAARAAFAKHKSVTTPGFHRDMLIATAKLATEAARNFTNKRADRLALRLDAFEKQLRGRDEQVKRNAEHVARLQTKVDALERFKADK